jgi:hypothetical protein
MLVVVYWAVVAGCALAIAYPFSDRLSRLLAGPDRAGDDEH